MTFVMQRMFGDISTTLSGVTSKVNFLVSTVTPSNSILVVGATLFSGDSSNPQERVVEISLLVEAWLTKKKASLRDLQSLLDKLHFIATCVRPGRIFVSRLLNWLRKAFFPHICTATITTNISKQFICK
jgi:hypothetical protein